MSSNTNSSGSKSVLTTGSFISAAALGLLLGSATSSSAATACSAAWSASSVYTGGQMASESSINYTAAYWTQGNNPATNNGVRQWLALGLRRRLRIHATPDIYAYTNAHTEPGPLLRALC